MSNAKRPSRPTPTSGSGAGSSTATRVLVAVIALVCVVGIVVLAVVLNNNGGDSTTAVSSHPEPKSVDDVRCDQTPAPQTSPKQYASAPDPALSEHTTWNAVLHTTCGDIHLELDGKAAPQTVASFIQLARDDYWKDSPCHRLTTQGAGIYVLQCGDPTGTGQGSPGYGFGIENAPANGDYPRGTIAMARGSDPNSNGSQFFMVYKDTQLPTQGGGYTIFGHITGGIQVLDAIAAKGGEDGNDDAHPFQPISILSVEVSKA